MKRSIAARITVGFSIVMVLLIGVGVIAYISANSLSSMTVALHDHPFVVTNALNVSNADVIAISRSMKDVALAHEPADVDRAVADIDQREKRVLEQFALVRERFLGDQAYLKEAVNAFAAWKPIRDDIIKLASDGKHEEAGALARTKGVAAVAAIDKPLQAMRAFADNKAQEFMTNANAAADRTQMFLLGAILLALVAAAGAAYLTTASIVRPVRALRTTMLALAEGSLDVTVPATERSDEIGEMAKAVDIFKGRAVERQRLQSAQKETETAALRKADMLKLADEFQTAIGTIIDGVSSASTELEAAAATLTRSAETTQELSTAVATASEEASANVNSVASSSEELASSVNEIARQVQESTKIAHQAVHQAQQTDVRIAELSKASSRIGDAVKIITAIAEQTNLLALNATIEAARAGEAGKGFAVVASEVKALASQTAKATGEIGAQINSIQMATDDSVAAIKEIGGTITHMSEIAAAIASSVEQQGAATQEISRNVQQAAQGTAQVASHITNVSRGAGETGSASSQVLSSAKALSNESAHLKLEVEKFLGTVRTA